MIDIPVDVVAGGNDELIPVSNLQRLTDSLNAKPGQRNAKLTVFPSLGHLDFTLGLNEQVIRHVLREMGEPLPPRFPSSHHSTPPSHTRAVYPWLNGFTKIEEVFRGLDALHAGDGVDEPGVSHGMEGEAPSLPGRVASYVAGFVPVSVSRWFHK